MRTSEAIELLASDASRTGIFSDFDGTISPVVATPEEARPADGAIEVFETLAERFALVAIVSGRSLEDLKMRFRPRGVLLAGAYGRERSDAPGRRATEGWETVAVAASVAVKELPGVRLERKGAGIALHYRQAPDAAPGVLGLADTLATEFGLEVRPGRRVVELVVPGPGKGDAMVALATQHELSTVFVAGDDVADLEAFETIRARPVRSVIAAVTSEEAPAGLADDADLVLDGPASLVAFLELVATR